MQRRLVYQTILQQNWKYIYSKIVQKAVTIYLTIAS
jgi:hypothetical protein